jgi:hypothetical protein
MNRTELKFLKSLHDAPAEGLPWSRLPVSCQDLLTRLCTCGAVQVVPGRQGKRLRVANAEAFARIVHNSSPQGLDALLSTPTCRATAVEQFGDAKAVASGNVQGVFVRTSKPNVSMQRMGTSDMIDVTALTRLAGGAAIMLGADMDWGFSGTVATIENEEAFWRHDLVMPEVDLAIYVRGKMSNRLLIWLVSAPMADCHITHWGDYDPIGVLEYVRLRRACPGRVRLHVPSGLDELVGRYGKRRLVQADRQTKALCSLRKVNVEDDPTVARLVKIFDEHGKGLEQEILLALASGTA